MCKISRTKIQRIFKIQLLFVSKCLVHNGPRPTLAKRVTCRTIDATWEGQSKICRTKQYMCSLLTETAKQVIGDWNHSLQLWKFKNTRTSVALLVAQNLRSHGIVACRKLDILLIYELGFCMTHFDTPKNDNLRSNKTDRQTRSIYSQNLQLTVILHEQ